MISSKTYDLIIFGAGFSGLSSAYYFRKKYPQKKILIIEKDKDVGGLASNIKFKNFKLEKFYHHWYEHDKEIFDLIKKQEFQKKYYRRIEREVVGNKVTLWVKNCPLAKEFKNPNNMANANKDCLNCYFSKGVRKSNQYLLCLYDYFLFTNQ